MPDALQRTGVPPVTSNPLLHEYAATVLYSFVPSSTVPLVGLVSDGQVTISHVGTAAGLHPAAPQVADVAAPLTS